MQTDPRYHRDESLRPGIEFHSPAENIVVISRHQGGNRAIEDAIARGVSINVTVSLRAAGRARACHRARLQCELLTRRLKRGRS